MRYVKNWFSGTRLLLQLLGREQLHHYFRAGVGLEVVEFTTQTPHQIVLVIAPHPGDEIFGCGGILSAHAGNTDPIHVIYLTDGSRSTPSGSRDKSLVDVRETEAIEGLRIIGPTETQFWRFPDTTFAVNKTTVGLLKAQIEKIKPDRIYIPWYGDRSSDNVAVAQLLFDVFLVLKDSFEGEVWQYETDTPLVPNRLFSLGEVLEKKIRAMDAHHHIAHELRNGMLGLNTYRGSFYGQPDPTEAFLGFSADRFLHFYRTIHPNQ